MSDIVTSVAFWRLGEVKRAKQRYLNSVKAVRRSELLALIPSIPFVPLIPFIPLYSLYTSIDILHHKINTTHKPPPRSKMEDWWALFHLTAIKGLYRQCTIAWKSESIKNKNRTNRGEGPWQDSNTRHCACLAIIAIIAWSIKIHKPKTRWNNMTHHPCSVTHLLSPLQSRPNNIEYIRIPKSLTYSTLQHY